MRQYNKDTLEPMRSDVIKLIKASYPTVEAFCWEKNLSKATVSNFLKGKKDFQLSTLLKIAEALGKRLVIRLDT